MLVSLEAANAHLRVDHDEDDNDIALKLQAASAAVLRYLKTEGIADFVDSSGTLPEDSSGIVEAVPADVRAATLLMLGYLYKDRDNDARSEEHTSELQSLMRISYAVLCVNNKKKNTKKH